MVRRHGNGMEPALAALRILPAIRQSLDLIATIFPPPIAGQQVLRVGVLPSFAANWLVSRLDDFHTAHPGITIALDARLEVSPIGPGGLDAAVRYGSGSWRGLAARRLVQETLFPACSPEYRERLGIERPEDLARCRLLRNSWQSWTAWFQQAGLPLAEPTEGMTYNDAGLILDAAVAGHGVALVRRVIAHDAIAAGRLVRLSPVEIPYDGAYHYVTPPTASDQASASAAFGEWIDARLSQEFWST